jgi:phenylalanyl-tRNA synthetase beta chain
MLYSLDWLAEYVDLPPETATVADRLTSIGFAVEGIESRDGQVVLDLEVNPNRPDCMNHLGMARELAAALPCSLRPPRIGWSPAVEAEQTPDVRVEIEDEDGCPRYAAIVVRGVRVGSSPEWLKRRLEAIGLRPINNVVDVTNYVLWEYGQPLHAFDLARLASPRIIVRRALSGERLVTLDGEDRSLDSDMLVIADDDGAIALAGIMGGLTTEVGDGTTDILIESAHFSPKVIRRGARKLAMHTDASHRFERGSDEEACLEAARRAATLIAELAGGDLPETVVDCRRGQKWEAHGRLDLDELEAFVGADVPGELVEGVFPALGFDLQKDGESTWRVAVPSWRRFDLEVDAEGRVYPAHLYEEALRFFGYDKVQASLPSVGGPDEGSSENHELREQLRRTLVASGLAETVTYSFYDGRSDELFPGLVAGGVPLTISNALSEQYSVMRRSLLPNLLAGARFNQNRGAAAVRLYEIGHVFPGGDHQELEALGIVLGGTTGMPWSRSVDLDFFDLKGIVDSLTDGGCVDLEFEAAEIPGFVNGTACRVFGAGDQRPCGYMGQVDEAELAFPLYAVELEARVLARSAAVSISPPSRFPGVAMDLTLTHPVEVEWSAIAESVEENRPGDLRAFGLKDRYQGPGVTEGSVNTTLFFLYNSSERSLTRDEVNDRHERLAGVLRERFGREE